MRLADVLKQYRWATKRTLRDMAAEIGVSHATLNRFEDGRGELAGETLALVLRWLLTEGTKSVKQAAKAAKEGR